MYLSYFEEAAYDSLKQSIKNNVEKYRSSEDWTDILVENKHWVSQSTVMVKNVDLLKTDYSSLKDKKEVDAKNLENDIANIRMFFDAYKNLSPLQAINIQMWAYLTHTKFKEYVTNRWLYRDQTEESIIRTINTRFFGEGKAGLIVDNAVSRLWWAGYLTYDENHDNHYHLTEILFSAQQIATDILDRRFSWNKNVMMGILMGLEKYKEDNLLKVEQMRSCIKYFGRYAAVTMVDELPINVISNIVYEYLKNH